uniref:Uncharacterized protein n=1 Tax=Arundo donax TaxID=35708 RepID=A0A0A9ACY1_ARUDO
MSQTCSRPVHHFKSTKPPTGTTRQAPSLVIAAVSRRHRLRSPQGSSTAAPPSSPSLACQRPATSRLPHICSTVPRTRRGCWDPVPTSPPPPAQRSQRCRGSCRLSAALPRSRCPPRMSFPVSSPRPLSGGRPGRGG